MKISVFSAAFNASRTITSSIHSVLNQSYKDIELIITDDGSTDKTKKILETKANSDSRLKLLFFAKNKGPIAAFANSYKACSGDLIIGISSNDFLIDREFFQIALNQFKKKPFCSGVFGKTAVIEGNRRKKLWVMGSAENEGYLQPDELKKMFFSNKLFIPGSSFMMNNKLFMESGGYDSKLGPQADYFLNHAMPMQNGVFFINREVTAMRKDTKSFSAQATHKEFFRRHVLFRDKLDSYLKENKPSAQEWKNWQDYLINARLSFETNIKIYKSLKHTFENIHEWEKDGLEKCFNKIIKIFSDDVERSIKQLIWTKKLAEKMFAKSKSKRQTFFQGLSAKIRAKFV